MVAIHPTSGKISHSNPTTSESMSYSTIMPLGQNLVSKGKIFLEPQALGPRHHDFSIIFFRKSYFRLKWWNLFLSEGIIII